MLLALALAVHIDPVRSNSVLIDPPRPEPVAVTQAAAVPATITRSPYPKEVEPIDDFGTRILRVNGHRVRVGPTDQYAFVDAVEVAKDGSLLITRRTSTDFYTVNHFIRVGKRERQVKIGGHDAFVETMFDANNYAGTYYAEVGAAQYPLSPPTAYTVVNGKANVYGLGDVEKAWPDGEVIVTIPIDIGGRPTSTEFHDGDFLRFYSVGQTRREIGRLTFVDASPDRTLLLRNDGGLYTWRAGHFLSAWRLPNDWKPVKINGRGDILVRYAPPGSFGHTSESIWRMAILRSGRVTPIAFVRPKGAEDAVWRDTLAFRDDGSIRFTAFGKGAGTFEIRPVR